MDMPLITLILNTELVYYTTVCKAKMKDNTSEIIFPSQWFYSLSPRVKRGRERNPWQAKYFMEQYASLLTKCDPLLERGRLSETLG